MSNKKTPRSVGLARWMLYGLGVLVIVGGGAQAEEDNAVQGALKGLDVVELYVGPWSVTERHMDRVGNITSTVKGNEEVTWQIDQRAIQFAYHRPTGDGVFRAIGLLTYNAVSDRYEGTWMDNHTSAGPLSVSGEWNAKKMSMTFTLTQAAPGKRTVTHRVVERFLDETQREATTYRVEGGKVVKLMERQYIRIKPCPAKIRGVFTG